MTGGPSTTADRAANQPQRNKQLRELADDCRLVATRLWEAMAAQASAKPELSTGSPNVSKSRARRTAARFRR
jgi:hypothetical protein